MATPPTFLLSNAAGTNLEAKASGNQLFYYRPGGFVMNLARHCFGSYVYRPTSGQTWAQAHSNWASQLPTAAWSTETTTLPSDPTKFWPTRIVGYLNDPLQDTYVPAFQQSVRVLYGNIISIRYDLPAEALDYKDALVGFEIRVRSGAGTAQTTFNAGASDYIYSYSEAGASNLTLALRMTVTATKPSKPENVLQATSFQTNLYSLQAATAAQAPLSWYNCRIWAPGTGPVFQSVSGWTPTDIGGNPTYIVMNPSAAVGTAFADIVKASSTGSVWLSIAITEDFVYPIPMRTNLYAYLGNIDLYAKF